MAKSAAFFPSWVETVGKAKAGEAEIKAWCHDCNHTQMVDYDRLIAERGADYSLVNKRTRCKRCGGWVFFHYLNGCYRPLWDDRTAARWNEADYRRKHGAAR